MTPARFQTIEQIYRAALDQEPDQIGAFLDTACEGDEVLRRKVEALLSSREHAADFIETSAVGLATRIIQNGQTDLLIGRTFGHYKISKRIGVGGMGEVYLARDERLGRKVALKLLPEHLTEDETQMSRFETEARAASALNHPNILTVHEIGAEGNRHFIATEFIEGETLRAVLARGKLDLRDALNTAIQVGSALAAAHKSGVFHRDIKPENIMLRPDGYVKVLDFGIAKLGEQKEPAPHAQGPRIAPGQTQSGLVVGTAHYMSPEQARGQTVDARSDIWSLGVVLYEMLAGRPPFEGKTPSDCIAAVLKREPSLLALKAQQVPAQAERIVRKALRKDREERYQSVEEVLADLRRLRESSESIISRRQQHKKIVALLAASGAVALVVAGLFIYLRPTRTVTNTLAGNASPALVIPEKSIAVLPLENLSEDKENAFFADGVHDELLSNLAKIKDLKVISRTSVMQYKSGVKRNLKEIAQQLGVGNVVEGRVRRSGDQVRVSVQLIDARTDRHLWGENYDRTVADSLALQGDLATEIAAAVGAALSPQEKARVVAKPTNNPEAYDAYLRGLAFEARSNPSLEAASFYERAVQFDPNFAIAWARLSRMDAHLYFDQSYSTPGRGDAAKHALKNAQKLVPDSPETLLALGYYQYWVLRDNGQAKTTFERVSKMLPSSSEVPRALGTVTRWEGHWDQSIAYFERALALDPRDVDLLTDAALTYAMLRQFPAALKLYDRALDIMPNDPEAMAEKACIYQAQGNLQEAARLLAEINEQTPNWEAVGIKITQLRLERNYGEAVRLLRARLAQFHYASEGEKADDQLRLARMQRLAADSGGAKATAEEARNTLEPLYKDQPNDVVVTLRLAWAHAMLGERALALKEVERVIMLYPSAKNPVDRPSWEESLAFMQTMLGENSPAISTLRQLLQTPYIGGTYYPAPITAALLRLDPFWDPLRGDPAFRKLCEEKIDKSIAVLPFENLSRDPDNAYFAEGIQEEILTRLAKIADLKVISRTSTQRYQSMPRDLGEIAKQLGVANVLEGSVQKVADQVRVNVKLINAQTDSHLWAETFDRKLTDIFEVESEIAKRIVKSLEAKLTGGEEQTLAVKPTNNPEAYDAYLRGLAFEARSNPSLEATSFYEQAVQLDPNFALAWARLSRADAHLYFNHSYTTPARGDAAKHALENAQRLAPDSPETLLALGYYQYWVLRDNGQAKTTFERVSKMLPNSSEVPRALGTVTRWEGRWDQSIAYFERALALDPRDVDLLTDAALTYAMLRQFPTALKLYDRALDIMPNDPEAMAEKARIYQAQGNLQEAARFLAEINEQTPNWEAILIKITQLRLERNYGEAVRLLRARLAQFHYASEGEKTGDQLLLARMQRLAADSAGAKATAAEARNTLEPLYKNQPNNITVILGLAWAHAMLGERALALKEVERVIMLYPSAKNPAVGPTQEEHLAAIQTIFGDNSRAISTLRQLLQTPYLGGTYYPTPITAALLRLDPLWDPLRADPAFQELCEEKKP